VRPATGVGYGLAEITGLAWAGCIPAAEAARLVAQCGQVLRACACGTAAMARVTADAETAHALGAPGCLHIAAYEGPRMHGLAGQVTRPVLFAQAMAQAAVGADLIVTAGLGSDAGLAARAAECGGVPAVPIPAVLPPGNKEQPGVASAQAIAALFTAGALTDLTPFLAAPGEGARARGHGGREPPVHGRSGPAASG